jgi:maleate isomerase
LPVVTISADASSRAQFDAAVVAAAAATLADARVDLILWNGTASSWLGFDHDAALLAVIEQRTAIPATSAVAGVNAALARIGARRIGLVTPYVAAIEADIVRNYAGIGIAIVAAERLDLTDNVCFAAVPEATIAAMIRTVAAPRPDAIVVMCTNLAAAGLVGPLRRDLGIPVVDSVRAAVAHGLERLGLPAMPDDGAT